MVDIHIILILSFVKCIQGEQKHRPEIFKAQEYAKNAYVVLKDTMRTYYETSVIRISETKEMRFMYEESPHYEQGYLLGEIIERYRKSVEHVQRSTDIRSNTVMDVLKRTEFLQKLHFEIYHLCNMMHEIALKYQHITEFSVQAGEMSLENIWNMEQNLKWQQKKRMREKKKRLKMQRKLQAIMGQLSKQLGGRGANYNMWWPLDYGWEIDYYW